MRIVAGRHRGRPLTAPPGLDTRPTSDRTRQAVFNVLEHGLGGAFAGFEDAVVIDAFAGTGALGLEALSRGARHATFIDVEKRALNCIRDNATVLEERPRVTLLSSDATALAAPPHSAELPANLCFLDAPYGMDLTAPALAALCAGHWLAPGAVCVAEVAKNEPFDPPAGFEPMDERSYGRAKVVFITLSE